MQVMRKNIAPLKAELRKKKREISGLKSTIRGLKETMKAKNDEILLLSERNQGLEEEKLLNFSALEASRAETLLLRSELDQAKIELEQARVCSDLLDLLERKNRLYPLKKRKIY